MLQRAPGGVWVVSILLGLTAIASACGDDDAAGGGGATSTSATEGSGAGGAGSQATGSTSSQGTGGDGASAGGGGTGPAGQGGSGSGGGQGGAGTGGDGGGAGTGGSGGGAGGEGTGGSGAGGGPPIDATRFRVVAGNLTSGNNQSWDPGHGKRILQGVEADVLLLQELKIGNGSAAALRDFADDVCGAGCDVYREPISDAGDLPNGIISRHPIVASGWWNDPEVSNRELAWARIDLPGSRDLLAVSVHFLTSSASDRDAEAEALIGYLQDALEPGDLVVLGGDFNTDVRGEAALDTLGAIFDVDGPYPVDTANDGDTNASRTKPYDWVLASDDLHALELPVEIGAKTFETGLVVDTRTYSPIADLSPALASDSDGPSMQHMAVVRDFAVPME